jgi:hypothetical protein
MGVVSSLSCRTACEGRRIHLSWINPGGTSRIKIVRRTGSWPFDLTDSHTVVYDGALIAGYSDPPRSRVPGVPGDPVGLVEDALTEQTYYYYTVLASDLANPTDADYEIADSSRGYGLSISEVDSKAEFFWKTAPIDAKKLDRTATTEGGGGGFLDKVFSVEGCWLNLLRGIVNAVRLNGDVDKAPYHLLASMNESLGTTSEGDSYDYDVARGQLAKEKSVYRVRGTCPGIVEAVRMFTGWESTCAEVGLKDGCSLGAMSMSTWDGYSRLQRVAPTISVGRYWNHLPDGSASFSAGSTVFNPGDWEDGKAIGPYGDVVCVASNDVSSFTTRAPTQITSTIAGPVFVSPQYSIEVESTSMLYPGMSVQIYGNVGWFQHPEILDIATVTPPHSLTFLTALENDFGVGAKVSIGKGFFRIPRVAPPPLPVCPFYFNGFTVDLAGARWVEDQWKGCFIRGAVITANSGDRLFLDTSFPPGEFSTQIVTGDESFEYQIMRGVHPRTFDPMLDMEERGSVYDPFTRLWSGTGTPIQGVWGPTDLAIYITSPVVVTRGKGAILGSSSILNVDPSATPLGTNELIGMYLNPNQNQEQTFLITSNTPSAITVSGDMSGIVVESQYYYVLRLRDRNRFVRLSRRLKQEFSHQDVQPRVLFV